MPGSEVLLAGATFRTMSTDEPQAALLLQGDRIAAVGTVSECRRAARHQPREVDLDGATVLPGFIDAHCHPLMHGQFSAWIDCGREKAPDITSVVQVLSTAASKVNRPVRGCGFHHGYVAEQRMLNRHDLDKVCRDREVLVFHSSGHGAIVNSWILDQLGITADTPDPPGGHFGREADGVPNGEVWDAAADWLTGPAGVKITNNGPNFHLGDEPVVLQEQLLDAQREMHRAGITGVVDAQVTRRELEAYIALRRSGQLTLRVEMLIISSLLDHLEALGVAGRLGDDLLALAGVKLYVDGSLTGATARFSQPYCCDPTDFGYLYHDTSEFRDKLARVHRLGLQTGTHAQGDAAIEILLDAHAAVGIDPARRHRIEHFGQPTPEQVQRAGRLGLWAITQPQYIGRYGDELKRSLGERAERTTPLGELERARTKYALSSDAPVCPPGPIDAIYRAVTRRTAAGSTLGDDDQRLTVTQAVRAHTIRAAESIHRERAIGSLEPGKLADLVTLSDDPLDIDPEGLPEIEVLTTWVGGKIVHRSAGAEN